MANLSDLSPSTGSHRRRKRIGRGNASGHGGTSTKGHKGLKARTGGKVHPRREGGQTSLIRRIPKRGFTNITRVEYQVVNVRDLGRVWRGLMGKHYPAMSMIFVSDLLDNPGKIELEATAVIPQGKE